MLSLFFCVKIPNPNLDKRDKEAKDEFSTVYSAVKYFPDPNLIDVAGRIRAAIQGFEFVNRLTDTPDDDDVVENDLATVRDWYSEWVGFDETIFQVMVDIATEEIEKDLRSPGYRRKVWAEAWRVKDLLFGLDGIARISEAEENVRYENQVIAEARCP